MEEDFFVGFDNDMDDFQNIVGKIKQRRADLKEATGAKTVLGAKLKRVIKPSLTQKNLKDIRDARKTGAMPTETPTGRFIGVVHYQRLLREPPATLLGAIVDHDSKGINPDASLHEVSSHLASYNMLSLPVVDSNERLLGAVTVDDVLDHLLPENWRHDHREKTPITFESENL